jgi:hypothetical protein
MKMKYLHVLLSTLIFLYIVHNEYVQAIRCANNCWFGPVQLGSHDPFRIPCDVIDINPSTTECTAAIAIKLSEGRVLGFLNTRARTTNMTSTLKVALGFDMRGTRSLINYTCTTTDNCDQDFVRESVGSAQWKQLNDTKTRAEISSLLFDSSLSTKNFTCAHDVICQVPYNNCEAEYTIDTSSSDVNRTQFDNNFTCIINRVTEIYVFHYLTVPIQQHTIETKIMCNKNHCNEKENVERAYEIIENGYVLPLNYSQFLPGTH